MHRFDTSSRANSLQFRLIIRAATLAACLALLAGTVHAATINVPVDQPTIQAAITAASNGDTILVAPGTYNENINFLGKAVTVTTSGGPSVTTINGGGLGTVVMFITNEGRNSLLSGFTITNGYTSTNYQNLGVPDYDGGGIYIQSASPTITGNVITNNVACGNGGGIAARSSSALIQGNTVSNNSQGGCSGGIGGGIAVLGGAAQIIENTIADNFWMGGNGAGLGLNGAGNAVVKNNVIRGNTVAGTSPARGGGIYMINGNQALIVQNLIISNGADQGGGVYVLVPSGSGGSTFVNNTIVNNAGAQGSGIYAAGFDSQTQLINNLVVAVPGQPALYCDGTSSQNPPLIQSTDAFSSGGNGFDGTCAGLAGSNGNISADPLFFSPADNFHVQYGSPVVDAGANTAPNLPATDLDGSPRLADGNNDGIVVVDMGAYEFGPTTDTISPSSLAFGDQAIGTTSAAHTLTVTNTGNQNLLLGISVDSSFTETDNCSVPVAPGSNCTIDVTFSPVTAGTLNGSLTLRSNTQGSPQTVALTGSGLGAMVGFAPTHLSFGPVEVGASSAPQTVTLQNTGNQQLNISAIGWPREWYAESDNCLPAATLAPGASCTITITFTPTTGGLLTGYLVVSDNAADSPQEVFLSGTGIASTLTVTPTSLNFGNQAVGTTGVSQPVTLHNNGGGLIIISTVVISTSGSVPPGTFGYSNGCGPSLAANSSCTISVYFSPRATGPWAGQLVIYDSDISSPQSVSLSGTGVPPVAQLSPARLDFAQQTTGTTSPAQTVTLTNTGSAALGISSISTAGPFAQVNNCGSSVAPGARCFINVTYSPTSAGTSYGVLYVTDSIDGTQLVSLTGLAVYPAPTLSPGSLTFGVTNVGTTSASQLAVLTNPAPVPVSITSITASGDFAQTNNCGSSLAAGASCTISVTFKPTLFGYRTGAIWISDNASGSPQIESLIGTGADFALSASPSSFIFKAGGTARSTVTATAQGGSLAGSVALSCSGLPAASTCAFSTVSVTPGSGSAASVLTIQTTKRTGKGGTPAGTYTVDIFAADGTLAHRIYVTLIVN